MTNKQQIQKLKNYAELAWATYGYFHLAINYNRFFRKVKNKEGKEILDDNGKPLVAQVTLYETLSIEYKDYEVYKPARLPILKPEKVGTLKGDFSPTQAKNFFKRYELLIHQPNTSSGFSATLFQDKESKI